MSKRCEVCSMNFIDEYSYHGHLMGKKHAKSLEFNKQKTQREQNSIFMSPVPPFCTPQIVFNFFSKFGPIQHWVFNPRYVIVEYKEKSPADYLLQNPVFMNNWKLKIQRRKIENVAAKIREKAQNSPEKTKEEQKDRERTEAAEALVKSLMEEKTFDDQLTKFLTTVQADQRQVSSLTQLVCVCLDRTMKQSFPKSQAIPFGSSITGLSLVGSDLDIFLDIHEPIYEEDKNPAAKRQGWTQKTIFKEVKSLLFRNPTSFTKVVPIPMAKIPVIKFRHLPTEVDCDISFKHGLGVHNSQLIKYLLTLDSRIKPMIIIIKYWARKLDISGSGKINNYSLVMLIIFYLQQKSVNLLPTIRELQEDCPPVELKGWQVNFRRNYPQTTSNNPSSIPELLEGFFNFYADFDFATTVICPLDGTSPSREEFKQRLKEKDIDIESLKLTRLACLQDPIQLNHNIISGWSNRELQALKFSCLKAIEVCLASRDDPARLLPGILDIVVKTKSNKKAKPVVFALPSGKFAKFGLPEDFDAGETDENKVKIIEDNWFRMVYKILVKILEKMFKFEVQTVFDEIGLKQIKLDEESDVHSKDRDKIVLCCTGNYCLNRSRKPRIATLDPTVSPIEREAMISDRIVKDMEEKKELTPIKFTCVIEKKRNPLLANVIMADQQFTNKAFVEIAGYMRSKIPSIVDKEFAHMVQFDKKIE